VVCVWVKNVLSSMVKIAWEREEEVFMAVSLDWRAEIPRVNTQNASYNVSPATTNYGERGREGGERGGRTSAVSA